MVDIKKIIMIIMIFTITTICLSSCERKLNKNIKKEDYRNTQWLEINGKVSKGYQPFINITYYTYSEECRKRKYKNFFDHAFMYVLTHIIPVENALYSPRVRDKKFDANLTRDKKNYTIRYPNNFEIDGCRFDIDMAWLKIKKIDNVDNNQKIDGNIFKFYFMKSTKSINEEHNLTGNYICYTNQLKKNIECRKEGIRYTPDYIFIRDLYYKNELLKENNVTVNISITKQKDRKNNNYKPKTKLKINEHNIYNFEVLKITDKDIQSKNKGLKCFSETISEDTPLLDISSSSYDNDAIVIKTEQRTNYYSENQQNKINESLQKILHTISPNKNLNAWIVVEPLKDTKIVNMLKSTKSLHAFIFNKENKIFKKLGAVAISIKDNPKIIKWVINNWGKQWFTIFVSSINNTNTISHMRNLAHITINKDLNTSYIFRYYNPIVFSSWVQGLIKEKKYHQALSPFTEIIAEGEFPHMLKSFYFDGEIQVKEYDLRKNIVYHYKKNKKVGNTFLNSPWEMGLYEYNALNNASTNGFEIKLCKDLIEMHHLLKKYTLSEVYTIISREVERATEYGMRRKDVLAYFVNIRFEHEVFWNKNQHMIQKILEKTDVDEVDRLEIILKAVSEAVDKKENTHAKK